MPGKKTLEAFLALSLVISGCVLQEKGKQIEGSTINNDTSEDGITEEEDSTNIKVENSGFNNKNSSNEKERYDDTQFDSIERNTEQKNNLTNVNSNENQEEKEEGSSVVTKDSRQNDEAISNHTGSGYSDERVESNPGIALTSFRIPVQQSVQENGYYCVPACLQMVLRVHGIEVSQNLLAQEMNTSSVTGTEYVDLQRIVNKYCFGSENINDNQPGYHIQTIAIGDNSNATMSTLENRIRADMASNDPVFIAIDRAYLYPNLSHGNHMIILIGYSTFTGTNTIANYYIIDPSYVVQDPVYGGLKIVTPEELLNAIAYNEEPAYIW